MKKCPKCSRTYADDGFTFCLEDGALLSAPYDPDKKEEPVNTIQSGGPPPTAVLPGTERGRELAPTVKTGRSPTNPEEAKPPIYVHPESPRRTSPLKYVVIGLVALIIVATGLGFIGVYLAGTSNCPKLAISCGPSEPSTYCSLIEDTSHTFNRNDSKPISDALCSRSLFLLQAAPLPKEITKITWSASAGTIRSNDSPLSVVMSNSQMSLDTSGLAGKTIEVKAIVTSSSWFCSTTVSTSFVVPGPGPASF